MKMTIAEIMNTIVMQNISVSKVIELKHKINVSTKDIYQSPMTYYTLPYNCYEVTYTPLYDTTQLIGINSTQELFLEPISEYKSIEQTNMVLSTRLPQPTIFVVKGFSILTDIPKKQLDNTIMDFVLIAKSYARMPLSHLPFEYPDNRIILSEHMDFRVRLKNEGEAIRDKIVLFINGWQLRAIQ